MRVNPFQSEVNMRSLLLMSAIVAVTACSDSGQTTTPAGASHTPSLDQAPPPVGKAKPVDQIGFTKTQVAVSWITIGMGAFDETTVGCPAGTTVVGGGFQVVKAAWASPPFIHRSQPHVIAGNIVDGWQVAVDNSQPNSGDISVQSYALCAS